MTTIHSLFDAYKDAVYRKDVDAFLAIFDKDVSIFDMWDVWRHDGSEAWRTMAQGWFGELGTDRVVVTFDEIRINEGADMAVAYAFVRYAAVSETGDELRFLQNRLTWGLRKQGDKWLIIHEHTSSPIDPETTKAKLKR